VPLAAVPLAIVPLAVVSSAATVLPGVTVLAVLPIAV
jgi:hypothetical protein